MNFFSKFKKIEKLSPSMRSLYLHKVTRDIGAGLVGMFGPIFWYVLGGSLEFVLCFYGVLCLAYIFIAPVWAKFLKCFKIHVWMMVGVMSLTLGFLSMFFLSRAGNLVWWLVGLVMIFLEMNRLFYWVPYHIDFTLFVDKHHRGRQLSWLAILVSLIGIVLPIFSAFLIINFGYPALFIFSVVIIFISVFPLSFVNHVREAYTFGYIETFKKLFSRQHVKTNLAHMADGFQSHIGAAVWPVFIFMILKGEYYSVGLVSAAVVLVGCVLRFVTGEMVDRADNKRLIKTGTWLYSLGWVFKAVVGTAFHVFIVGVYHNFTSILMRTSFDVLNYEIGADEGNYVDEFTILREISINVGRVLMVVLALLMLSWGVSIVWIFVLGAVVSLFMNLVSKEEFKY